MKKFTLLLVLFTLIKLNSFGQHTPETALRFDSWNAGSFASLSNSSYGPVIPGLNYGGFSNAHQIAWTFIPVCDSSSIMINFNSITPNDTIGYCIYGPFADTSFISSQLLTATPVSSRPYSSNFSNPLSTPLSKVVYPGVYYFAWCINNKSSPVNIYGDDNLPPTYHRICNYCNDLVFMEQYICLVTLDSVTQRNFIIFDKGDTTNISGYILFRENSIAGQYDSLTFIHRDSASVFIDLSANPSTRNWRYMIHRYDVCGTRLPSCYQGSCYQLKANTIHLQQGVGTNNSINLIWNNQPNNTPLPGSGGFIQSFFIYRSNGVDPYIAIDSIPIFSSAYTDVNPNQGLNLYQVAMRKTTSCTITRNALNESRSNVLSTTFTGLHNPVKHNFFILYPNPAQHEFTVEINENNKDWRLSLFNLQGQLLKTEDAKSKSKIQLNCDDLPAGIYTVKVSYLNTDYYKKLVIE